MFKIVLTTAGRVGRLLRRALWLFIVMQLLRFSTLPLGEPWARIGVMVSEAHFDYLGWTLNAIGAKAAESLYGAHPYMSEPERADFARQYFADVARAQRMEAAIEAIYADPNIADHEAATADQRAERDALRADLAHRQSLAEAIIEGQVAAVLVDEGYGIAGQLVPPIAMRFSPAPTLLVISPRDRISIEQGINLYALPVDERAALEARIDAQENVASLIVPLGGIALYPALVLETSDLRFAIETFAHEWLHHYLFMYPLGWSLEFNSESRLINETAANMFGQEIAAKVYARYYPEFAVTAPEPQRTAAIRDAASKKPAARAVGSVAMVLGAGRLLQTEPPFDFGAAMHETRTTVDALLAAGQVEEAEAYMAERQALFFENGYRIRKLNQAYFAFYGGYQVGGVPGIAGEDPIGPALRDIRAASPTIHDFTAAVRGITTRAELLAARDVLAGG